ncbi:MAG: class I SAM-dependent methyltransferase [Gammaproteobacteria bacterium]|nr:class I SAM-dependent methyltransferase [Gammaproteobacteria bacterium]
MSASQETDSKQSDAKHQIEQVITIFEQVAQGYDNPAMRFFPFCGDRIALHLQLKRGEKVLDIAAGTGAATVAAAQLTAPEGRVQAIDLAENMLDKAYVNLQRAGLSNADFHVMDALQLDFKSNYFDAVICSFGLFFLPDMLAALKEWKRVLKPGGRLIFTSFTAKAFQPLADLFRQDIIQNGVDWPEAKWQLLSTEDECRELLQQAGFTDFQFLTEQLGYHLNEAEDWWEVIMNSGFRGMINQLKPDQLESFQQQHLEHVRPLKNDKGVWMDVETLFSSARCPT